MRMADWNWIMKLRFTSMAAASAAPLSKAAELLGVDEATLSRLLAQHGPVLAQRRDTLKRNEVCVSGTVVALLYAVIAIHMSAQTIYSLIPFVLMYLVVLADIVLSIYHNLKVLKAQLLSRGSDNNGALQV